MKIFSNAITRYDNMIYASRPANVHEFLSDKYNNVHIELFNDALKKYFHYLLEDNINSEFIYRFFRLLENTNNDIDDIYRKLNDKHNDDAKFLNNALSNLSIDKDRYFKYIIDVTNNYIERIKNTIIDNEILIDGDDLTSIISDLSRIGDFRILYLDNATFLEAENDYDEFDQQFSLYEIQHSEESDPPIFVEKNFFLNELEDYVFILENERGTRIGYNIDGHFLLILDTAKYNKTPLNNFKFTKYIKKENTGILEDFKREALSMFKGQHRIIEIKNNEYWMPSSIVLISNVFPFKRSIVKLDKYWNNIQSLKDLNISDIKITKEEIRDAEIMELNYVNGMAKMRSKSTDIIFYVPFGYLNESIDVNDDYTINLIQSR